MNSHIVIVVQNGILPVAGMAVEPSANIIPALTADIRRFVVHLHVVLGQPFLQMLIACGDLTSGRRYNDKCAGRVYDPPQLFQRRFIEKIVTVNVNALAVHIERPLTVVQNAVNIQEEYLVHHCVLHSRPGLSPRSSAGTCC